MTAFDAHDKAALIKARDMESTSHALSMVLSRACDLARKLNDDVGLEDEAQRLRGQLPGLLADANAYHDYVHDRMTDLERQEKRGA